MFECFFEIKYVIVVIVFFEVFEKIWSFILFVILSVFDKYICGILIVLSWCNDFF